MTTREVICVDKQDYAGLVAVAQQFVETIEYYIRLDRKRGDNEGANLKSLTLHMVRETIAKVQP
jgi:hypothetical protein